MVSISSSLAHSSGGETLPDALGHGMDVVVADVVVVLVFLGDLEVVLALVVGGLDLLHIALADQAVDLIRGVGGRDIDEAGNSLMVGWPRALMISMQKVSTVVRLASRF